MTSAPGLLGLVKGGADLGGVWQVPRADSSPILLLLLKRKEMSLIRNTIMECQVWREWESIGEGSTFHQCAPHLQGFSLHFPGERNGRPLGGFDCVQTHPQASTNSVLTAAPTPASEAWTAWKCMSTPATAVGPALLA